MPFEKRDISFEDALLPEKFFPLESLDGYVPGSRLLLFPLVGVTFPCEACQNIQISRRKVINDYRVWLGPVTVKKMSLGDYPYENIDSSRKVFMSSVLIASRDPRNLYDPNAIKVLVRKYMNLFSTSEWLDVGYFPKLVSRRIVEDNLGFYILGADFHDGGMKLTVVVWSISKFHEMESEKAKKEEALSFARRRLMSLSETRKHLMI